MNKNGSGNKGLDWVIVLGMLAAYPKTADLLSYWSPTFLNELLGMNVSLFYGAFCAALVEGVVIFLHFDRRAHRLTSAQVVKWIMFGVSFACNIYDGFITTDTLSQMSTEMKVVLTYAIPALPLIIAALVASIGALPDDDATFVPKPRVGLKGWLESFYYGDQPKDNTVSNSVSTPKEVVKTNLEDELPKSPNGEQSDTANPTKAGRR
jgi:hypothetical protein